MKKIVFILLFALACISARAQLLGIKSNMLMDAAMVPDLGLEIVTSERTSVALDGFKSWKIYGTPASIYGFNPDFRYWINGRPFDRFYAGAGLSMVHYDIDSNKGLLKLKHDYIGAAYGGGLDFGYVLYLKSHLALDFRAGIGVYHYHHTRSNGIDAQGENEHIDKTESYNARGWSLMPYQLGVSLVYIVK